MVTVPEKTFETGYGSKHMKWRIGGGGGIREMGREKKNKRSFVSLTEERRLIAPDSFWEFAVPGHFSTTTLLWHCPALCHIPLQSGT